ncbi:MAG: hypothetical protein JWP89_2283 [Schlesneria sp.]|nr:hypothetical protein [Schlesneria sp.]
MTKRVTQLTFALMGILAASTAEAGLRYVYAYGNAPYYPVAMPYYAAAPTVAGYTTFSPQVAPTTAMSGHVLVPARSVDGTPSYGAYHPTLGTFLGWWQLIGGVWQFVQSNGASGGTTSQDVGVTKTDFNNFVTQYQTDIGQIKTKLEITPAGTVTGNGTTPAPNTGPSPATGTTPAPSGGPVPGTAVAPQVPSGTSVQRLDDIIAKLNKLKIAK